MFLQIWNITEETADLSLVQQRTAPTEEDEGFAILHDMVILE
jgi:hypothetical protein